MMESANGNIKYSISLSYYLPSQHQFILLFTLNSLLSVISVKQQCSVTIASALILQLIIQMKANTSFTPNKKLILHFDVDSVLKLATNQDKDYFVYHLCASWVWGRLEKNDKSDADKITGWKIAANTLSTQAPEPDLITYKAYLDDFLKPAKEEYQRLLLGLTKGPASKAKSEIEKNIKNITLPKTLAQAIKEGADPNDQLLAYFNKTGKYQILPAFFKLLMNLKKLKREFAIVLKGNLKDSHHQTITELNKFFAGEHPLFNGRNGTPAIKWDGTKGTHNFSIEETHQTVFYDIGEQLFSTYGSLSVTQQKDPEMFKQKFKSFKSVKLCQGVEQIYAVSHTILAQSACIYEVNPLKLLVIDPSDYLTQEIYFTSSQKVRVHSCTGQLITDTRSFVYKVTPFQYFKDVDYFIKAIQSLQSYRASQINKIEKGQVQQEENLQQVGAQKAKESNYEYLKKHLLPVLQGALRQVDILRPQDPLGFIALYCLKNREKLE